MKMTKISIVFAVLILLFIGLLRFLHDNKLKVIEYIYDSKDEALAHGFVPLDEKMDSLNTQLSLLEEQGTCLSKIIDSLSAINISGLTYSEFSEINYKIQSVVNKLQINLEQRQHVYSEKTAVNTQKIKLNNHLFYLARSVDRDLDKQLLVKFFNIEDEKLLVYNRIK